MFFDVTVSLSNFNKLTKKIILLLYMMSTNTFKLRNT